MTTLPTTPKGEMAAMGRLSGDWDEDGTTSVHLPADIAPQLLAARGWTLSRTGRWTSPDGHQYWHASEALQVALVAEAMR